MNLEARSDSNLVHFFKEELRHIEQMGRKPPTVSHCTMNHLRRYGLIYAHYGRVGRRYTLSEKCRELLEEER